MEKVKARLEISGLDEVIQDKVYKAVQLAVKEIVRPLLDEFKAELIATASDELIKKPRWTKRDIMAYTGFKEGWVYNLSKRYPDFPKKLNKNDAETAVWDRDELIKFFARHPEIPTTARKDLEIKKKVAK